LVNGTQDHGTRPVGDPHTRQTLSKFIGFLATMTAHLGEPMPQETKDAIEAELAKVNCPAAIPWFRKAVAAAEAGTAPAPKDVESIKGALVTAAESRAFKIAATHLERAERESREPTAEESEAISMALMDAAKLRVALFGDIDADAALAAAKDPTLLQEMFAAREAPTGSSLVDVRGSTAIAKPNTWLLDKIYAAIEPVKSYHGYSVEGVENIPKSGRCIIAFNHSLATYDIVLFAKELKEQRGRTMRMLGDHLIFKTPGVSQFATACGVVDGRPEPARQLVEEDQVVGVAPGGMAEMLRPTTEAYELMWDRRRGFAKMAFETGAPIVLAACPNADDLYYVYDNPITRAAYDYLKIPVPVFTGRFGVTPIPEPAELKHVLSKPIYPPPKPEGSKPGDEAYEAALNQFHQQLIAAMEGKMVEARTDLAPEPMELAAANS